MTDLSSFWDAIKQESVAYFTTVPRFKSSFQTWLNWIVGYGEVNTDALRSWALRFSLTRREFADLVSAYIRENSGPTSYTRTFLVEVCPRCTHLDFSPYMIPVREHSGEQHRVCSKCARSYYFNCNQCGQYHENEHEGEIQRVDVYDLGWVCLTCFNTLGSLYGRCDHCHRGYRIEGRLFRYRRGPGGGYIDDEEGDLLVCQRCKTPEQSRCRPKQPQFSFPALNLSRDNKAVVQDEIVEIATGGGDVSQTGLTEISNLIQNRTKGHSPYGLQVLELTQPQFNFDTRWMTREGNMPKRIAKILVQNHNLKLTEELMSEIGNIAQRYTSKPGSYRLSITRDVNQPRHLFVNGDSCWWTSYWWSRCTLKALGGFGLRTWDEAGTPIGRAWMIPMQTASSAELRAGYRAIKPAPEMLPADAYIIFNGYGPHNSRLDSLEFGRMVAAMTGKSYRKIDFVTSHHMMYVNGTVIGQDGVGKGVLVAPQEICDLVPRYELPNTPVCSCPGHPMGSLSGSRRR